MPYYEKELAQIVAELNRAAPTRLAIRASHAAARTPANLESLDQLLMYAARQTASDLLLIAGAPVTLRIGGELSKPGGPPLEAEDTRSLLLPLLTPAQTQELQRNRSVDLCFHREGIGRFRANIHYQRGTLAGSLRLLPERIPTLESLNLPPMLRRLCRSAARPGAGDRTHRLRKKLHAGRAVGFGEHAPSRSRRDHRGSSRVSAHQPAVDHRAD